MLENAIDEKKEREKLQAKRNLLYARFVRKPQDTRLALEIKIIDDQIAQYTKQMEGKRKVHI